MKQKILSLLEQDSRLTASKVAIMLGIDEAAAAAAIKELEDENLRLRIENAYLKELRRLRLEEEALLKKQRESSTVSEDNSN